mgnify:FL=1
MKRLLILLVVLLVPVGLFAQIQVGGTALYNYPIVDTGVPDELDLSNFTFGADARLKIAFLQVSGLALFTPGEVEGATIDIFLDGGLSFDIMLFRLGLGLGPNLRYTMGPGATPLGVGLNVKATADVMLGSFGVGLTYLNSFELDFSTAGQLLDEDYSKGLLGISVLFEL